MEKLMKQIGNDVLEYSDADYAQHKIDADELIAIENAKANAEKQILTERKVLLDKLGITEEEVKLLLN